MRMSRLRARARAALRHDDERAGRRGAGAPPWQLELPLELAYIVILQSLLLLVWLLLLTTIRNSIVIIIITISIFMIVISIMI